MTGEVPGESAQRGLHRPPERAGEARHGATLELGLPGDGRSTAVWLEGDLGLVAPDRHPADGVAVAVRQVPEDDVLLGGGPAVPEAAAGPQTDRRRVPRVA